MAALGAKFLSLRPAAILFFIFIFLWQSDESGYQHVWPELSFGWQATIGTIIGFLGAAFGSVGGVGGGGIFVPMLTLIIGFDPKSATAISKCMIMGAAVSTVYHNLRLRHPTLDLPVIDYDLVLLIQPMLMLGISIGVTFNVIFPDWAITVILIILCIGTSVKAFFKGLDTWQMETILKQDATKLFESTGGSEEVEYKPLPDRQVNDPPKANKVTILQNILLEGTWTSCFCLGGIPCCSDCQELYSPMLNNFLGIKLVTDSSFHRSLSLRGHWSVRGKKENLIQGG
ncbi:hypothetical protein OIU78_023552 [Salix suchowensis]|nr:hypothetical protein OIU78_023552 [Salix suchowensis]